LLIGRQLCSITSCLDVKKGIIYLIVAHQSTRPKSMNTGHVIKQIISKNNSTYLEDNPPKGTYRLSTISHQSLAKQLRATLSYKYLQKCYFLIKAHCFRLSFYVTRVAAGMPFVVHVVHSLLTEEKCIGWIERILDLECRYLNVLNTYCSRNNDG
jgi:hypothetical protein